MQQALDGGDDGIKDILAYTISSSQATSQVWFQNRRMKDKRQKMTWPCGDPMLAAYVLQVSYSY